MRWEITDTNEQLVLYGGSIILIGGGYIKNMQAPLPYSGRRPIEPATGTRLSRARRPPPLPHRAAAVAEPPSTRGRPPS